MKIDEEIKQEIIELLKQNEHLSALRISRELKEGYYKTIFYLELMKNEEILEMIPVHKHTYHWRLV
jgi:hypothetical protein